MLLNLLLSYDTCPLTTYIPLTQGSYRAKTKANDVSQYILNENIICHRCERAFDIFLYNLLLGCILQYSLLFVAYFQVV